uniref:Uncharacterized protein n=1 Tax=Arundo donax TaxID=35708 RepID=A0A0A9BTM6_ARUDO
MKEKSLVSLGKEEREDQIIKANRTIVLKR